MTDSEKPRNVVVGVSMRPKEKERLKAQARMEGRSLANWCRRVLLRAVERVTR